MLARRVADVEDLECLIMSTITTMSIMGKVLSS